MSEETKTKRPKAGTYPTFTSRKKGSTVYLQKAQYGLDEFKTRKLVSEKVSVTVQRGTEFDVYRECLGGEDGKGRSPYFHKLMTEGYLENGKVVKLDPDRLQKFLESQVGSLTNTVYLWKDRPRTPRERELEDAVASGEKKLEAANADKAKMLELLKKHNIKFEA